MMTTGPSFSVRLWRRAPWHRSPLLRRRDRLESAVALGVIIFVVMMAPLAATVGTVTYGTLVEQARQDIRTHRQVEATVLDTAPVDAVAPEPDQLLPPAVDQIELRWVRWNVDGHTQIGRLSRPVDAQPGATINLWVDRSGVPVDAPHSGRDSATTAVLTALTVWAAALVGGVGFWYCTHRYNEYHRLQEWEREWRRAHRTPGWPVG
ncbi:hypothetical protein C6369_002255 [Rhodococcus rhodochrous]|nr:hypothetical protein C6369_002255 [Rhodococcus rhodochrous]OWY79079.1 hypothetical protein B9C99_24710 [Rhodococcus sp. BUPNP1]